MKLRKLSIYQMSLVIIALLLVAFIFNQFFLPIFLGKSDLKIGIIDSGCEESQDRYIEEFKSFTKTKYGYYYDENSPYDPENLKHGRQVCEIIIDNTRDVDIYSAKIANSEGIVTYAGLFAAMSYLLQEVKVDIINLSLGGEPYLNSTLLDSFAEFADDTLLVAAVGNNGERSGSPINWPASLPWVVAVGAVDNTGNVASYSSYGKNIIGLETTEFTDLGFTSISMGTSFATPRIVAKFVNLWQELRGNDIEPTPSNLVYFMARSTGNPYDGKSGWGTPPSEFNDEIIKQGILFEGYDETDPTHRFLNESWNRSWKYIHYNVDVEDIILSGSGSEFVEAINFESNQWGGIMDISFYGLKDGQYELDISHPKGNMFTYSFTIVNNTAISTVLLDHRLSINGFSHANGQYSQLNQFIRSLEILPVHIFEGSTNLSQYDGVLVTELGSLVEGVTGEVFYRNNNADLLNSYVDYTKNGGNIQFFLNPPNHYKSDLYQEYFIDLGANITTVEIPKEGSPTPQYNFSQFEIFDNVDIFYYHGIEVKPVNSSQTSLGYYRKSVYNGVQTIVTYYSLGINTTIGSGSMYIWGSSVNLLNDFFTTEYQGFNQYLQNYFNYYL